MIIDPLCYEIMDAHAHLFRDFQTACIGNYGKPETMEEFDAEMHRVVHQRTGSPIQLKIHRDSEHKKTVLTTVKSNIWQRIQDQLFDHILCCC